MKSFVQFFKHVIQCEGGFLDDLLDIAIAPIKTLAIDPLKKVGESVGLFGGGGGSDAPQFNPDLQEIRSDIGKVRDLRDREIEGVRQSAQITLDEVEKDRARTFGDIQAGSAGRFAAIQDTLARGGGLTSGARERLASQSGRDAAFARQGASGDFAKLGAQIRAQDLGQQEALKNQALFKTPQLSAIPLEIQTQANAANMRAKALADEADRAKSGALGSLIGAGAGFALGGGPAGAGLGAKLGGGLFSSFS